jgi:hypothetical protein
VSRVNELRASKGLGAVTVDSNLSSVAQNWALHMGQSDAISHRASLAAGVTIDWRLLGENVGIAPDVNQMMDAFIASPSHYKNLVNPNFNRIGIGTVSTPDGLFSAHEFAQVATAAAPAPVRAPSAVVTKAPAAPTTIVAPATTSTTEAPASTVAPVSEFNGSPISNNISHTADKEEHSKAEGGC